MASNNLPSVNEKANLADARWINTPFSFAQFGKDFSLLQQHIMIKISDHLQEYLSKFFKDGRHRSPEDPLSLFPDDMIDNLPEPTILYSEFGVDNNNSAALYKAIQEVMGTHIFVPTTETKTDENGVEHIVPAVKWANVFMESTLYKPKEAGDKNYKYGDSMTVKLNKDVVKYVFNMRLGYINHPVGIAMDSNQEYAPRLYFSIKHRFIKGKKSVVVPYKELREETGMNPLDNDKEGAPLKERYPHFSKFKMRVIDPAIADINRMADSNLIDIHIDDCKFNYPNGKSKGDPISVEFVVSISKLGAYHKDPKRERASSKPVSRVADTKPAEQSMPRKRGRPRKVQKDDNTPSLFDQPQEPQLIAGDRAGEWQMLVEMYGDGPLKPLLDKAEYLGTLDGAFNVMMDNYDDCNEMSSMVVTDAKFKELLAKAMPSQSPFNRIKIGHKINS